MFLAAVVQINSRTDVPGNWQVTQDLIRRAAGRGAKFVATPENTNFLGPPADKVRLGESLNGPTSTRISELAKELGIHLLLGSFNEKSDRPDRVFNTSVLFGTSGQQLAVYRKIHLFDVDVADGAVHRESHTTQPGQEVVVAQTPLGKFGLSICYDLRFGELYRQLVERGAEVLCVPSAFLTTTGRAHWEVLLRARAIENQSYVLAPGQWGRHEDHGAKESYGHSMIVDPWGQVLAMAADGPGIAMAEIDRDRVAQVRRVIPMRK
jgi:deaminated glutathione amidase